MKRATTLLFVLLALTASAQTPDIATATAKLHKIDGYVPLYWDADNGKLMLEISRFGEEMIYQTSLPGGVGSNPIGLDRNQLGATHIVRFERVGPRVLMIEPNYRYRALTDDAAEERAVADSFAQSILAGFKVEAASGSNVLVYASDFFLTDLHGVARTLRDTQQGNHSVDKNRSAIYL